MSMAQNRVDASVNFTAITAELEGFTGSDIKEVCTPKMKCGCCSFVRFVGVSRSIAAQPLLFSARRARAFRKCHVHSVGLEGRCRDFICDSLG